MINSKKHILVVEDEQHVAVGIKYNLEAEGYRVTLAADGPTALRLFESDQFAYDLILLDLMLPGMSGYRICEEIRNKQESQPILILSARSLSEDRTRGFDVGANQYLTKPFDLDELLARVRNLLRLRQSPAATPRPSIGDQSETDHKLLEFGDARINFETHEVSVKGNRVKLTTKEIQLMSYFAKNEGRVIPRQELLSHVWDINGEMQTRSVDQFMMRLRKVFEPDPAKPRHLLTIRDAGYRFVRDPDKEQE
jgi:two-component system OmpR family response regulator